MIPDIRSSCHPQPRPNPPLEPCSPEELHSSPAAGGQIEAFLRKHDLPFESTMLD